eukprot:SAG31_NODE_8021_length_1539_cov_1.011806_2_plen_116_part_00
MARFLIEKLRVASARRSQNGQTPLQLANERRKAECILTDASVHQVASYLQALSDGAGLLMAHQRLALALSLLPQPSRQVGAGHSPFAVGGGRTLMACLPGREDGGGDIHDMVCIL